MLGCRASVSVALTDAGVIAEEEPPDRGHTNAEVDLPLCPLKALRGRRGQVAVGGGLDEGLACVDGVYGACKQKENNNNNT